MDLAVVLLGVTFLLGLLTPAVLKAPRIFHQDSTIPEKRRLILFFSAHAEKNISSPFVQRFLQVWAVILSFIPKDNGLSYSTTIIQISLLSAIVLYPNITTAECFGLFWDKSSAQAACNEVNNGTGACVVYAPDTDCGGDNMVAANNCPNGISNGWCGTAYNNSGTPSPEKNKGKPPKQCDTPLAGNPTNVTNGNKFQSETDVHLGFEGISFTRYYNSAMPRTQGIGMGWSNAYLQYLDVTSGVVSAKRGDGKVQALLCTTLDAPCDIEGGSDFSAFRTTSGFEITNSDGSIEIYDNNGKLFSILDLAGRTQTLTYNISSGLLEKVDSENGTFLHFVHDSNNRIEFVNDHTGRTWQYQYDVDGNLEFVIYPDDTPGDDSDNPRRQYHYNEPAYTDGTDLPHALTGITDENGIRYATYEYYADGRAMASYHAGNAQRVDITYNDTDGTRTVTNSKGISSTYSTTTQIGVALVTDIAGPGCLTCGSADSSYVYDPANNNLLAKVEKGIATLYGNYDRKGQYGCKVEGVAATDPATADNTNTSCQFDAGLSPDARRTDFTYDPLFYHKIATITEPSVHAGSSKVTTHTYDDWGNRLTTTVAGVDPDGNPVSRFTTREFDGPLHQLSFVDGPRTDVNDFTYYRYYPNDTTQPIGTRAQLREVEDANGVLIRRNIAYTATGKVASEDRPNGLKLRYDYYPGNDRLKTLTEEDTGTNAQRTTYWTYLNTGEVTSITQAWGSADATTLTFGYDAARRLTDISDGLGNRIHYTLDTEGNREQEIICAPGAGDCTDASPALTRLISQTFDLYNRLDLVTRGETATPLETLDQDFSPDGTLDLTIDGEDVVTDYSYDAFKRLTRAVQDRDGSTPATTAYDYDVADRLTRVEAPNDGVTTYSYDDLGNLLSQVSPDTGTTDFTYDSAGNLKTRTEAVGTADEQVTTYTYDALNRLTVLDAPGSETDLVYTYDTCGGGRLCSLAKGGGALPNGSQVHYRYNGFGEISAHQGLGYSYDTAGRLETVTYPSGARLDYAYDPAGQVTRVDLTVNNVTQTLADNLTYAPFGPLTGLDYGNDFTLTRGLDTAYRTTFIDFSGVWGKIYSQYDGNGNLQARSDANGGLAEAFTYTALNQLDTASGDFGQRDYDYFANGNREQVNIDNGAQISAFQYVPASNRLTAIAGNAVARDTFGNTRAHLDRTFDYDPQHRLSSVTDTAILTATYAYNGLGQRITKTLSTSGLHFLYGPSGELRGEADDQGNILYEYLTLDGQLLAVYAPDDDGDGLTNAQEAEQGTLPANADDDGDGLSNRDEWYQHGTLSFSADSDGDGVNDDVELAQGTNPNSNTTFPGDGDINQDGDVNVSDLLLLYQFILETRSPTAEEQTHGDMNRDGSLTIADVLLLQKQLLLAALGWDADPITDTVILAQAGIQNALDWLITPSQALPPSSGALYYVHNDHLGTPQAMTDESGTVVWRASYDPFGKASLDPANTVELNVRFPGQYYDAETGLHYNYFRYYDPETGRYLTSDPIGLDGGLNTYLYTKANPIILIDPFGLDALCPGRRSIPDPNNPGQVKCVKDPFTDPNEMIDPTGDSTTFPPSTNSQCTQCCFPKEFKKCMNPSLGPQDVPGPDERSTTLGKNIKDVLRNTGKDALMCAQIANIKCAEKCNKQICEANNGGRNCDAN